MGVPDLLAAGSVSEGRRPRLNPGIQGLRGVAVALVVLYHGRAPGMGGGFVGVDVFFVISGFVIASRLVSSARDGRRPGVLAFYAARFRRLLPTTALVLLVTMVWMSARYAPDLVVAAASEVTSAAAGVVNFKYAVDGSRYGIEVFGPYGSVPSPFAHLWSLAVEEQFYLLFPLVVAFVIGGRGPHDRGVSRLRWVLLVIGAASFGEWILLNQRGRFPQAFYLLDARAWQLLVGAVLAVSPGLVARVARSRLLTEVGGTIGLAALILSSWRFTDPDAPTPHLLAVAAAVLLLPLCVSGSLSWRGVGTLLRAGPLPLLGSIAFPLYLWHWIVVLDVAQRPSLLGVARWSTILGVSLTLAIVTHLAVERPVRWARPLVERPRLTFALGILVVSLLVVASGLTTAAASRRQDPRTDLIPPLQSTLGILRGEPNRVSCPNGPDPSLPMANCVIGRGDASTPTIALVGDSHADHWLGAMVAIARERDWRVALYWKAGCPWMDVDDEDGRYLGLPCRSWRNNTMASLAELRPVAIVLAGFDDAILGVTGRQRYLEGASEMADRLPPDSPRTVLGDVPTAPFDSSVCLAMNRDASSHCAFDRDVAVDRDALRTASAAAERAGATFVDTTTIVCPEPRCTVVRGRLQVYRDGEHLAPEFAASVAGQLEEAIGRGLPDRPPG